MKIRKYRGQNNAEMIILSISDKSTSFGNKWVICDGKIFQSIKEAGYYQRLKKDKEAGRIKDFKRQVVFKIFNEKRNFVNMYIADFVVWNNEGKVDVVDVKGYRTPKFIKKKAQMKKYLGILVKEV